MEDLPTPGFTENTRSRKHARNSGPPLGVSPRKWGGAYRTCLKPACRARLADHLGRQSCARGELAGNSGHFRFRSGWFLTIKWDAIRSTSGHFLNEIPGQATPGIRTSAAGLIAVQP